MKLNIGVILLLTVKQTLISIEVRCIFAENHADVQSKSRNSGWVLDAMEKKKKKKNPNFIKKW